MSCYSQAEWGLGALNQVAVHRNVHEGPAIEAADNLTPVDVRIGKEAVEHVLLASEHLSEDALSKVASVFDGEEREQDLAGSELAVRSFGKVHLPLVKRDVRHYIHDSRNRLRIVTFSKKSCWVLR